MKYLCLIYVEEQHLEALPESKLNAITGECLAYEAELQESGHLLAAEALEPVQTATTAARLEPFYAYSPTAQRSS